jgi:hypothetical protein
LAKWSDERLELELFHARKAKDVNEDAMAWFVLLQDEKNWRAENE